MKNSILFVIALSYISLFANKKPPSEYRFIYLMDCVNYSNYSFHMLSSKLSLRSRPLTFSVDTSDSPTPINIDSTIILTGLADLSSEIGEPIFLRMTNQESQNREHGTHGEIKVQIPKLALGLMVNYRHLGVYSDKTEHYFNEYAHSHGNSLKYSNIGTFGIAEYITGQWIKVLDSSRLKGTYNNYGEWIMVPGLYIPVYRKGNSYSQNISLNLGSGYLNLTGGGAKQSYYSDHINSIKDDYYFITTEYKHEISNKSSLQVNANSSSLQTSKHHLSLKFTSSDFYWGTTTIAVGLWSGFEPEATFGVSYAITEQCSLSTQYNYNYSPGEKSITIVSPSDTIITNHNPSHSNNFIVAVNYANKSRFPLTISYWTQSKKAPTQLLINSLDQTKIVNFSTSKNPLLFTGGEVNLTVPINNTSVSLWSRGNYLIKGKSFEFIPFECGLNISYESSGKQPLLLNCGVTWRGPFTWNARFGNTDTSLSSPDIFFGDFNLSIPFIIPFLSDYTAQAITFAVSPIPLYPSGRQQFHPYGSLIGPQVSVKLTGDILRGKKFPNSKPKIATPIAHNIQITEIHERITQCR